MALSDKEYLEANAHIPSSEVRQDIADTQREIDQIQSTRAVRFAMQADRLNIGRQAQIDERKQFIEDLQRLLKLRGEE